MPHDQGRELDPVPPASELTEREKRRRAAEEWLLELRREEHSLAPWLVLERVGEERKIRRS